MKNDNQPIETHNELSPSPDSQTEVVPLSAEQEDQLKGGVWDEKLILGGRG